MTIIFFSAYNITSSTEGKMNEINDMKEGIKNSFNNYKRYSKLLCANLEKKYSKNQKVAFKQNWSSINIEENDYDIYEIQMVSFPDDKPIIKQLVYVKKMNNYDTFFSILYTDEIYKDVTMQYLKSSLKSS